MPLIFLRERIDLNSTKAIREVVDGQQRLRTAFAFVDPGLLDDFRESRDTVTVRKAHNPEIAGRTFRELDDETKRAILGYRFSVQTLPANVEDRDVLQIFARLNATGTRLNDQELRNAAWFGEFKTRVYELAYGQLERWLSWGLFTEDQISRMGEVEFTSELVQAILVGPRGKSQAALDRLFRDHDNTWPQSGEVARRFETVMEEIDGLIGSMMASSASRGRCISPRCSCSSTTGCMGSRAT